MRRVIASGIDGESGRPLLDEMTGADLAALVTDSDPLPGVDDARCVADHDDTPTLGAGLPPLVEPTDLESTGWGIVFAAGVADETRDALARLCARRSEEAGDRYEEFELEPDTSWAEFLDGRGAPTKGVVDPTVVPYYLLLVGAPTAIPWEFQRQLGMLHAVGRLDLGGADEYARYVDGVLAAAAPGRPELYLVAPEHPGDEATELSCRALAGPLRDHYQAKGDVAVEASLGDEAVKDAFLGAMTPAGRPRLTLTASHGIAFAAGHERQRPDQGALVTSSWAGGSPEPVHDLVAGRDVDGIDARGLISLHMACFSAGTPVDDTLAAQRRATGSDPDPLADEPFCAALPGALLGADGGSALAVIGHVDRAYPHSFVGPTLQPQTQNYRAIIDQLLAGIPVGAAMRVMALAYTHAAAALTTAIHAVNEEGKNAAAVEVDDRWIETADAGGYAILGDPAVRLGAGAGAGR